MKRVLSIVFTIILAIILALGIVYIVDKNRTEDNKLVNEGNKNDRTYTKIEDANLFVEGASTDILVRFNGILYGKSYAVIDYAGNPNGPIIGKIDKLIDKEYVPTLDGETNAPEILGATVDEATDRSLVLNYNNEYVAFDRVEENNETVKKINEFYKDDIIGDYVDIRKLDTLYSKFDAQKDNCFVIGAMVHNDNLYYEFMKDYKNKKSSFIRVAQNTTEGDLIINDIKYDAELDKIIIVEDNTRDVFSNEEDRQITIREYDKIGEYKYNNSLYWIAYNGEINDEIFKSNDTFIITRIN